MASTLGVSKRSVMRAVRVLDKAGFIEILSQSRGRYVNRYRVMANGAPQSPSTVHHSHRNGAPQSPSTVHHSHRNGDSAAPEQDPENKTQRTRPSEAAAELPPAAANTSTDREPTRSREQETVEAELVARGLATAKAVVFAQAHSPDDL